MRNRNYLVRISLIGTQPATYRFTTRLKSLWSCLFHNIRFKTQAKALHAPTRSHITQICETLTDRHDHNIGKERKLSPTSSWINSHTSAHRTAHANQHIAYCLLTSHTHSDMWKQTHALKHLLTFQPQCQKQALNISDRLLSTQTLFLIA